MNRFFLIVLSLVALLAGCAGTTETDPPAWHYVERLTVPHEQGCTVARSLDPAVVKLEWPARVPEQGWWHPCQDGSGELCPDISAPGMFVDVYARGDVDALGFVAVEACR
jgi:hypothetical protein